MPHVMRTLVFAVHNPSRQTAATLHRALRAYTHAASAVLDAAQRDWQTLREEGQYRGTLSALALHKALVRHYHARTTRYPLHSSLRDALFGDLATLLCSYHTLCQQWETKREQVRSRIAQEGWTLDPLDERAAALLAALGRPPSWPTTPRTRPNYAAYDVALAHLAATVPVGTQPTPTISRPQDQRLVGLLDASVEPDGDAANRPRRLADLMRTGTRPLLFTRPDGAVHRRNFSLLRSEKDSRYYALLYLLPADDARRRPLAAPPDESRHGQLRAVHPSGAVIERTPRPSLALCLPLECGEWHVHTALEEAVHRPEMVRVARLSHRPARRTVNGWRSARFLLAITFAHERPELRTTKTYMGVAFDEESRVTWVVRDPATGQDVTWGVDETLCGLQERWRQDRRLSMRAGQIPGRAHHLQREQVKHAMHILCNRLVTVASEHTAQVALTDVHYLRARRTPHPQSEDAVRTARSAAWHARVGEQQYRRATLAIGQMEHILSYKLPRAGLPRPLMAGGVSPRDCAACGARGTETEQCSVCGATLGGGNTARVTAARVPIILERIHAARVVRAVEHTAGEIDSPATRMLD